MTGPPTRSATPPEASSDREGWAPLRSTRIVVVDDDAQVVLLLAQFVQRQGYAVRTARGGREALEILEEWPADLVVADIIMPEMDGIELIRTVKEKLGLPVVAISGGGPVSAELLLRSAGYLGASAILEKPFSSAELAAAIQAALG